MRTQSSRTFANPDGTMETELSQGSLHYRDARGAWEPIDNTLVADGPVFRNRANRFGVDLPRNLADGPVRVSDGDAWVSFALSEARATAAVHGARATYANARPGVSLRYDAVNDGLKETVVLDGPSSPASFTFSLATSPGLSYRKRADRGIDFVDAKGRLAFSFAPPWMEDSSREPSGRSQVVSLDVANGPSGTLLTVDADPAWLKSPERVWPVMIDPTVLFSTTQAAGMSTWLSAYHPDKSQWFTYGASVSDGARTIIDADVSAIPRGAQVLNAELSLWVDSGPTGKSIDVHRLTEDWTWEATWNRRDGTTPWATPGGSFDPRVEARNNDVGVPGRRRTGSRPSSSRTG